MTLNFFGKSWNKTSKNFLLSAILLLAVTSLFTLETLAQKGIVKFDYEYKSNAQGKLKAERTRGNKTKMYYDSNSGRWIVEVDYGGSTSDDDVNFDADSDEDETRSTSTIRTETKRNIVKFDYEYKSNAEGKLKVERERGRNARMYFSRSSRRWIVEVDYGNLTTIDDSSFENDSDNENTNYATKPQTIIYHYEYKSNAEGKLKVERNRGKSARMFYDKTVGRWAVEVEEN